MSRAPIRPSPWKSALCSDDRHNGAWYVVVLFYTLLSVSLAVIISIPFQIRFMVTWMIENFNPTPTGWVILSVCAFVAVAFVAVFIGLAAYTYINSFRRLVDNLLDRRPNKDEK